MGVPSYFAWWAKRYRKDILKTIHGATNLKSVLYLDFNGAIHPAVRTDATLKLKDMNDAVTKYLLTIVNYVKPDEVYIAIDGVAPAAKMAQQRDRRYKSTKESKIVREIALKYGKDSRDEAIDFNMISPGTEFMWGLQKHLEKFIEDMSLDQWKDTKITINGSGIPGEGEHKIMSEIRSRNSNEPNGHQPIIYGLDADLMFLSILNAPNTYLIRENVQFRGRKESELYDTEKYPYIYLDIQKLKSIIIDTLNPLVDVNALTRMGFTNDIVDPADIPTLCSNHRFYTGSESDQVRIIRDYAYICFYLGNDFLPHLPALKIRNGSLNDIILIYKKVSWMTGGYFVTSDGKSLNRTFLTEFLHEIAYIEDELLRQQSSKRLKDINGFKNRLKHMDPMKREMETFQYVEDQYIDLIKGGTEGWRIRYYQHQHNIKHRDNKEFDRHILPICQDYIKTTLWILQYYQGLHNNWSHIYSYCNAPTAKDLANMLKNIDSDITFDTDEPVSPYVQLMSILPPDSAKLLPEKLADYMTNRNSPIHYMYPIKVSLNLIGNKFYYECKAKLPEVDRNALNELVVYESQSFTDEELDRNKVHNIKSF